VEKKQGAANCLVAPSATVNILQLDYFESIFYLVYGEEAFF
jgi:hypothetical protein